MSLTIGPRLRRLWTWSIFTVILLTAAVGFCFFFYWYALWPIPPQWIVKTSPWLEPQLRAWNRAKYSETMRNLYDEVEIASDAFGGEAEQKFLPLLKTSDRDLRSAALMFLPTRLHSPQFSKELAAELIRAAQDPDPEIAHQGCMWMCYFPLEDALPVWRKQLQAIPPIDQQVRRQAFLYLTTRTELDDPSWIVTYLADPDPDIRKEAVNALHTTRDPVTTAAIKKLLDDSDANVRAYAQRYLKGGPRQ